jgi:biotin carboxyl carrier protein
MEDGWEKQTNQSEATTLRFDLCIDGKVYNVELDTGKLITIEVEGKTFQAETKKTSKGMKVHIDKKDFFVRFGGTHISVDSQKHSVEVRNLRRGIPSWYCSTEESGDIKQGKPVHKIVGGEGMIHPPMPGRVVSIKVKAGDSVKIGSPLLVLEAMKMQNEITSNMKGVVHEIRILEGDLVEPADVLIVIGA